jgi:lipopolysaccharide transport system ATP-binding protein
MREAAIQVEELGKRYRIGRARPDRATAARLVRALSARGARAADDACSEDLWALRDVSFEVQRGEVLGIIGGNGAGKSTLLKILSRITEPTCGVARCWGRTASLLEVGTGFHPELTGRENLYLSGALLGMRKSEVDRKLDAIVSFSGLERFLYTPVKRYSSGMAVRLAFSVAAHLEPEILIIDEVLAVGDVEFRAKSLKKITDFVSGGSTVLLVSHNLNAISGLCRRAIGLREGRVAVSGPADDVVDWYLESVRAGDGARHTDAIDLSTGDASIESVEILDRERQRTSHFRTGDEMVLRVTIAAKHAISAPAIFVGLAEVGNVGSPVAGFLNAEVGADPHLREGHTVFELCIESLSLRGGHYTINICAHKEDRTTIIARRRSLDFFEVESPVRAAGVASLPHHWTFSSEVAENPDAEE